MTATDTITRKELVALSGYKFSERTLSTHEREWGLAACKVKYCRRPVLYRRVRALLILQGLMEWK